MHQFTLVVVDLDQQGCLSRHSVRGTAQAGNSLFSAMRERYQTLIGAYFSKLIYLETGLADQSVEIVKGVLGPDAATIGAVLNILDDSSMSSF